tara:strand:+ start:199 stop:651 length:453 start_codon:yes stop_codon:yes gene_type:complete
MSQDKKSFIIATQADWKNFVDLVRPYIARTTFEVTADSDYQKRTGKQNRYIHVIFGIIAKEYQAKYPSEANEARCTPKFWKDFCKSNWGFRNTWTDLEDREFKETRSTADYSRAEETEFIEKIRAEILMHPKLGFNLLTPDEWRKSMGLD